MDIHYLDNAATTRVSPAAAAAVLDAMTENFGNPSSVHSLGIDAERVLRGGRESVARLMGCEPSELLFTSGGTESNNTALFRGIDANRRVGRHIITTALEHPSVLECVKKLEQSGLEVTYLKPSADGGISLDELERSVRPDTALLSMMLVCNETGARLPVEDAAKILKRKSPDALVHVDAVQAFGKLRFSPKKLGADLVSVTAHKLHGPKGIGALYIRSGLRLTPLIYGGGQERALRSGTESVPAIAGFGVACDEAYAALDDTAAKLDALRERTLAGVSTIDGVRVIASGEAIVALALPKYPSEVAIRLLESRGVFVSGGSACAKGHESHVLAAMRVEPKLIRSAIRVSFSRTNTEEDIDALVAALREIA